MLNFVFMAGLVLLSRPLSSATQHLVFNIQHGVSPCIADCHPRQWATVGSVRARWDSELVYGTGEVVIRLNVPLPERD
jgi:hypothetical protein